MNIWHMMTCEKYWKNATTFDPERYQRDEIIDHSFVPFGDGLRGIVRVLLVGKIKVALGNHWQCLK